MLQSPHDPGSLVLDSLYFGITKLVNLQRVLGKPLGNFTLKIRGIKERLSRVSALGIHKVRLATALCLLKNSG